MRILRKAVAGIGEDDRPPIFAAILMAVLQSIRTVWLARLPTYLFVQHIPDDAFYYLVLAKNYVALGRWTFDGVAGSTGFHLMWGYILAAIYKVDPAISLKEVFVLASTLSTLSLAAASGLAVASVRKIYGFEAGWAAIAILFSAVSMLQATWMMESPFVILIASLLLFQLSKERTSVTPTELGIAMLLGFLGSMARSDFGLLPFWLFVAWAFMAKKERQWVPAAKLAAGQLIGASLGVLVVLIHTDIVSGQFLQASAQTKLWWATTQGKLFIPSLRVGENTLSPFYNSVAPFQHTFWSGHLIGIIEHRSRTLLLAIVLIGIIRFLVCSSRNRPAVLTACMLLLFVSYCFFYRFDGAVQDWYVGNYEIPVILLVAAAWASMPVRWLAAARILVIGLVVPGFLFSFCAHAPWQEAMYRSGLLIRQHPEWKPVGAWNAGIMHYFAGDGVVNLDGLVNDAIVPDIKDGTLADYVAQRRIRYIIESPSIFTAAYAKRSGIADGKLYSCIRDQKQLVPNDPFDVFDNTHITIFHLNDACLENLR